MCVPPQICYFLFTRWCKDENNCDLPASIIRPPMWRRFCLSDPLYGQREESLQSIDSIIHPFLVPSNYMFWSLPVNWYILKQRLGRGREGGRRSERWTEGPGEEAPVPAVEFRSGGWEDGMERLCFSFIFPGGDPHMETEQTTCGTLIYLSDLLSQVPGIYKSLRLCN